MGELLIGLIKSVIIHCVWLHRITYSPELFNGSGKNTFTINSADFGAPKRRCSPNYKENIPHCIEETLSTSTWTYPCGMGVPHSTIWEVLHEQQLHTYYPQRVHAMGPADFALQANFCLWFLHHCVEEPQFPREIIFTRDCFKLPKQPCLGWWKPPCPARTLIPTTFWC